MLKIHLKGNDLKAAFTLIELIFVILIIGILAVVAIPRLNATRDDAQASTVASNVAVAVMDILSYYTSTGSFTDIKSMSNIVIDNDGKIKVKDSDCFQLSVANATASDVDPSKGIEVGSPILKVIGITGGNSACVTAQELTRDILVASPINLGQGHVRY